MKGMSSTAGSMRFAGRIVYITLLFTTLQTQVSEAKPSKRLDAPEIHLVYSEGIDSVTCKDSDIKDDWYEELQKKLPDLQKKWNREGASLMRSALRAVGKPFPYREEIAAVFLCKSVSEMGTPLQLSIRWYLPGPTDGYPVSDLHFIDALFHELLHQYVTRIVGAKKWATPLLQKYSKEAPLVLAHLHLSAIQQAAYLHLKREKDLEEVIDFARKNLPLEYGRAWDIVKSEGFTVFIDELK